MLCSRTINSTQSTHESIPLIPCFGPDFNAGGSERGLLSDPKYGQQAMMPPVPIHLPLRESSMMPCLGKFFLATDPSPSCFSLSSCLLLLLSFVFSAGSHLHLPLIVPCCGFHTPPSARDPSSRAPTGAGFPPGTPWSESGLSVWHTQFWGKDP